MAQSTENVVLRVIRQVLPYMALAFLINAGINYVTSKFFSTKEVVSQPVIELSRTIDFEQEEKQEPILTTVVTNWGELTFSTQAGALQSVVYDRIVSGQCQKIQLLAQAIDKEDTCFLLASSHQTPCYYKLQDVQEYDDLVVVSYRVHNDEIELIKEYRVYKDIHKIDLHIIARKNEGADVTLRLLYPSPEMQPVVPCDENASVAHTFKSDKLRHLYEARDTINALVGTTQEPFTKISRDKLSIDQFWTRPTLFGADGKYVILSLVADPDHFAHRGFYKYEGKNGLLSILESTPLESDQEWTLSFYIGPKSDETIAAVDSRLQKTFDYSFFIAPFATPLLKVLKWLYSFCHNYGFAIILLTLLIKLLLLPFSWKAEQGMNNQKEMQKKLAYIRNKYKNDPHMFAQEQALLLKKYGAPGAGGCLILLLQMPIFIGLSQVLSGSIELYHAPMLWIKDLSARDPYYILPMLVCITMLVYSIGMQKGQDVKQQLTSIAMACLFGAMSASWSAGLALYLVVNFLMSIAQTKLFNLFKKGS